MGLVPEWFPIIGKKNETPVPATSSAVAPFPATAESTATQTSAEIQPLQSNDLSSIAVSTIEPSATSIITETVSAAPDLSSAAPTLLEGTAPQADHAPVGLNEATRDTAIGMAAASNAFPGTVMPRQEVAPTGSAEEKPAA